MTDVHIRMNTVTEGHVSLTGHAGDDRICAAVSTLIGSVLNVLGDAAEDVVYESGRVEFDVSFTDGLQMGAFNVLVEAIEMLSENFPDRVGVTVERPDALE